MAEIVVGITGRKGHGKDTAASGLVNEGFVVLKFADPLKDMIRTLLRLQRQNDDETIERLVEGDLKEMEGYFTGSFNSNVVLSSYFESMGYSMTEAAQLLNQDRHKPLACLAGKTPDQVCRILAFDWWHPLIQKYGAEKLTARVVMQTVGTECFRDKVSQSFWTDAFLHRAAKYKRVVCTDMRFPNEVATIKSLDGLTLRIKRPAALLTGNDNHPSEAFIDTLAVDYEVLNIGQPWELADTVKKIVFNDHEVRAAEGEAA